MADLFQRRTSVPQEPALSGLRFRAPCADQQVPHTSTGHPGKPASPPHLDELQEGRAE